MPIDLLNVIKKKVVPKSGNSPAVADPRKDIPKKDEDIKKFVPEVHDPAPITPPKHLPRPTRR